MSILTPHVNAGEGTAQAPSGVPTGIVDKLEKTAVPEKREKFRYRSRFSNHMILLYAEPDTVLPGGKIVRGKVFQAKFKDGYWETQDKWAEKGFSHEQQNEWIRASENFSETPGHGDFWDADIEAHTQAVAQYNSFLTAIQSDPKLKEMLRRDLAGSDFNIIEALSATKKAQEGSESAE